MVAQHKIQKWKGKEIRDKRNAAEKTLREELKRRIDTAIFIDYFFLLRLDCLSPVRRIDSSDNKTMNLVYLVILCWPLLPYPTVPRPHTHLFRIIEFFPPEQIGGKVELLVVKVQKTYMSIYYYYYLKRTIIPSMFSTLLALCFAQKMVDLGRRKNSERKNIRK